MIESFQDEYRFLSNFYPCVIYYDGLWYPTSEHAYQAAKTVNFHERFALSHISSAGQVKRAGKKVSMRDEWDMVKLNCMYDILVCKFSHVDLARMLDETGDEELIEGNYWGDVFWGVCRGVGENNLGRMLMHIREKNRSVRSYLLEK